MIRATIAAAVLLGAWWAASRALTAAARNLMGESR